MQEQMERLSRLELEMNSAVAYQVERAFEAFFSRREETELKSLMAEDARIDRLEVEIDDLCFSILALHQPLAADLRYVVTVLKVIADMERMGDEAVSFCKRALYLLSRPPVPLSGLFLQMTRHVLKMTKDAIQAFTAKDVNLARAVMVDERRVNGFFDAVHNEFIDFMLKDPRNVQAGEHLIRAARCVERIADHACNVAEDVVYLVEGRNVKHQGLQAP